MVVKSNFGCEVKPMLKTLRTGVKTLHKPNVQIFDFRLSQLLRKTNHIHGT